MIEQVKTPVLLVDDEPDILDSLRVFLSEYFHVHTAANGQEAIAILQTHPIHVVMTDQRMPNMTGVDLLHWVRCHCPHAVGIVFTGYADPKSVVEAINRGQIYRYLTKPWDMDELLQVLVDASKQFRHQNERRRLLGLLRDHLAQGLTLAENLASGQCGTLSAAGQTEALQFAESSRTLLARLDLSITRAPATAAPV